MKKLIAIDGNSLLHRAYYALATTNMMTAQGVPTGALHGFLSMLLRLTSTCPDYLVVAFDMRGPTFRHESYDAYKAGRKQTPDDLSAQFPLLHELLSDMGIAICECPRYEADDILGTFSRMCGRAGVDALLVTGDRDALQLVDEHTHVLLTKRGVTDTVEYDEGALMESYGLTPDRMRDLKGLMGDNSDNIPGIPGVGEKTALKLLEQYGGIEEVLSHAAEVKGKLGQKLTEFADSARMSYALGTICTQAPIEMTLEDCVFRPEKLYNAKPRLMQLELRAIVSRLPEGEQASAIVQTEEKQAVQNRLSTIEELRLVLERHADSDALAMDLSTGVSFAFDADAYYLMEQGADLFSPCVAVEDIFVACKDYFTDPDKTVLVFDSKRLRHALQGCGITLSCKVFDVMIADYLLNAIRPAGSLDALVEQRLQRVHANPSMLFTLQAQMRTALDEADMMTLYTDMELPLSQVLYDMERCGFRVDRDILLQLQRQLGTRIDTLAKEIYGAAGVEFNILSPKQLGEVLFEKLELPAKRKTKSGFSTDADTLESLTDAHPVVSLVLEYRFITKLKSTFIDGLLAVISAEDGRVRSRFNQCVTATGRISSTEPNLQNIPVRTELGREIRKAFIASEGCTLVGADYSQIELRLLAHISGDAGMIAAFNSGKDIHSITASEVFGVSLDEVTHDMRSAAKAVNFGIVYGISDFGLARNLNIPVYSAREYIARYFARYPGVKAYLEQSVEQAKALGYAKTMFNRRRAMPELTSGNFNTRSFGERVAMNMPIQGTAADIIKLAMVHAVDSLKRANCKARLVLQVHDELIFDTPLDEMETVKQLVDESMEQVVKLAVPLTAEVKTGHSWFDTK